MRIHNLLGLVAAGILAAACSSNEENHAPAEIVIVSGNNQVGMAGTRLGQNLLVQVNDRSGDGVKGVTVTFTVTAGGGSVNNVSVTTDDLGQSRTDWTVGTLVGATNTLTAQAGRLSAVTFNATVGAGAAAVATVISGVDQNGTVGVTLAQPIVIEFKDAFGNVLVGAPVTWSVTAGGGSVPNLGTTTDANGRTSSPWTLGLELGHQGLVGYIGEAIGAVNAVAGLGGGSTLAIVAGNGQAGAPGAHLANDFSVRVRNPNNQNISMVPITWAVTSGGGTLDAISLTDAAGIARMNLLLGPTPGPQTVTATTTGTTPSGVTFNASALAITPSTIVGSVSVSDAFVSSEGRKGASSRRGAAIRPAGGRSDPQLGIMSRVRNTSPAPDFVANELIVKVKRSAVSAPIGLRAMADMATARAVGQTMRSQLARHALAGKVSIEGVSPVILMAKVRVTDRLRLDSVAAALAADPSVEAVGRNGWLRADGGPVRQGVIPNDPFYPVASWNYAMLDLPRAWSTTTGSSNIIVAVLDNGAVFFHPTIGAAGATAATGGGNYRNDGYDFVSVSNTTLCASQGGGSTSNNADGDGYDPDPSIPDDRDPDANGNPCARSQFGAHGTHVAGTIGAMGNDGIAAVGVNWSVSVRPVRVLGVDGGSYFDIAQGVLYASGLPADNGAGGVITPPAQPARILNMSLGGGCGNPQTDPLLAAVQAVTNPARPNGGVLVVVSAGNSATSVPSCPANYAEVLAVGAVGPSGHRATYSNFGGHVDLAAPGGDFPEPGGSVPDASIGSFGVLSSTCDFRNFPAPCSPNHAFYVGTSMASPHVAGVAALLLAANPGLTPADLRNRLITYATPMNPAEQIGPGIVNARNALTQTMEPTHTILVRAINSTTGAVAATATLAGGQYTLGPLPDASYYIFAGEDDNGDGFAGLPGRRFGAYGSLAAPTPVTVSSTAGAIASLTIGFAAEHEPNDVIGSANLLAVDAAVLGSLDPLDQIDHYKVLIPSAGTYTFETVGVGGAFCGYSKELNTTLELLDLNLTSLQVSTDIDGSSSVRNFCSRISRSLTPGTYYLKVTRGEVPGAAGVTSVGRYVLQARSGT